VITTEQLFDGSPRDMTPERVRARYEEACQMIADLCKPRTHPEHRDWTMSIPARPDYDPDLVIRDSLDDIPTLLERVEAAEARAERAEAELARVRPVVEAAERWHVAVQHYDAAMSSRDYGAADLADAELNAATGGAVTELKVLKEALGELHCGAGGDTQGAAGDGFGTPMRVDNMAYWVGHDPGRQSPALMRLIRDAETGMPGLEIVANFSSEVAAEEFRAWLAGLAALQGVGR